VNLRFHTQIVDNSRKKRRFYRLQNPECACGTASPL
jgi:hypothetical protein